MSTPLIETIAENIKTTIDGITTANGYNQNLNAIRPKRIDFLNDAGADLDVIITQATQERMAGSVQCKEQEEHFLVTAFVIDSDDETDSIDTRRNQVRADIEKALMVDNTRGGNAIDTIVGDSAMFDDDEGGLSGIAIDISVKYRTKYNDPYTRV